MFWIFDQIVWNGLLLPLVEVTLKVPKLDRIDMVYHNACMICAVGKFWPSQWHINRASPGGSSGTTALAPQIAGALTQHHPPPPAPAPPRPSIKANRRAVRRSRKRKANKTRSRDCRRSSNLFLLTHQNRAAQWRKATHRRAGGRLPLFLPLLRTTVDSSRVRGAVQLWLRERPADAAAAACHLFNLDSDITIS